MMFANIHTVESVCVVGSWFSGRGQDGIAGRIVDVNFGDEKCRLVADTEHWKNMEDAA